MPRSPRPWFRFYSESIDNPKLQRLSGDLFKLYINLISIGSLADPRGQLPHPATIAFRLRADLDPLLSQLKELHRRKLLDGSWRSYRIHDWSEWQPDSDNLDSPGRKNRHAVGTPLERGRNAVGTRLERATSNVGTHRVRERVEKDKEGEKEKDTEREREETRGRATTPPLVIEPADGLFSREYVRHYQESHAMAPPSPKAQGEARALETDFGSQRCIQAANRNGWDKHPNYYRTWLKDPKNGENNGNQPAGNTPAEPSPFEGIGT